MNRQESSPAVSASQLLALLQGSDRESPSDHRRLRRSRLGCHSLSRPPYRNFQTEPDANELFRQQLVRLDAFPLVAAHHSSLGYAVESQVEQLSVLDSDGQLFRIRRHHGEASTSERHNWQRVRLYELVPSESVLDTDQMPNFGEVAAGGRLVDALSGTPREGIRIYLAFTHPDTVHMESPSSIIAIPPEVIARDIVLESNETFNATHCRVAPSNRHCVAVYATVGSDGKESRTILAPYDTNWACIGRTERNTGSWVHHGRVYVRPFQIEHVLNVDGWDSPILVTSGFAREYPCEEFGLQTFLTDGRFATIRVPNCVVADDGLKHSCGY